MSARWITCLYSALLCAALSFAMLTAGLPILAAPPICQAILTETALPVPPQQKSPWTPPVGQSGALVLATAALFEEGMADPRGGEYRQVAVETGTVWSGSDNVVKAHAWLMPQTGAGPRFAVCWNGLVYPIVSVGGRADLNADVLALVKANAASRVMPPLWPVQERSSLTETEFMPLKACLLLRLGEGDLARRYWEAWTTAAADDYSPAEKDPYLMFATDWTEALFSRAVNAHKSGQDRLSVADSRQLTALRPVIEAEAGRRGFALSPSYQVPEQKASYFGFLDGLPRLYVDEERRVAETTTRPNLAEIQAMPDKAARIAALIQALDEVAVAQQSEPGRVEPDNSPIVAALVSDGDDAVQPLINVVATDTRLTRSVGFGRGSRPGAMLGVAGAAYAALVDILNTSEFNSEDSQDRIKTAAAIQTYWDHYKGLRIAERWYKVLGDDTASQAQWLEAAHNIVQPSDEEVRGGWETVGPRPDGVVPAPKGEALRQSHFPSVAALMTRRIDALAALSDTQGNSSLQVSDVEEATTMSLDLAAWDPQAALPVLRAQFETQRRTLALWNGRIDVTNDASLLTKLTLARMQAGDPKALTDYVRWLKTASFNDLPQFRLSDTLEPLWRRPQDPAASQGADYLFLDPRSPWVPLIQERPGYDVSVCEDLLESPMLCVAGFRQAMVIALADHTVVKSLTLGGPDRQADSQFYRYDVAPFRPATPQVFPIRRCDVYAWHLSHLGGMPEFSYDWPAAKKDAAIAAASARLIRYGGRFATDSLPAVFRSRPSFVPAKAPSLRTPAPC